MADTNGKPPFRDADGRIMCEEPGCGLIATAGVEYESWDVAERGPVYHGHVFCCDQHEPAPAYDGEEVRILCTAGVNLR